MPRCWYCGEETPQLHTCAKCKQLFGECHIDPATHDCPGIPIANPLLGAPEENIPPMVNRSGRSSVQDPSDDDARRERIKVILNKHEDLERRETLLLSIRAREVRMREEVSTIDLLEFLLDNIFTIVEVVVLTPDKKRFVRFQAGVVMGNKQTVPVPMQGAYAGHFIVRKEKGLPISYGERVWGIPMQEPWRVLIEVEAQLPLPRLSPVGGPPRGIMFIDPRMAFEKYETSSLLLKDSRLFEKLVDLPIGNWTIVGIYKVPTTEEEAEQQEKAWQDAQAFDPNPTNLPGMLAHIQKITKAVVDQLPTKIPKTAESEAGLNKLKASLANLDKMQADMNQMNFLFSVDGLANQDIPAAEARLLEWTTQCPDQPLVLVMLGTVQAEQFCWEDAWHAFSRAATLTPDDPSVLQCKNLAREALGENRVKSYVAPNKINSPSGKEDDQVPLKMTKRLVDQVTKALAVFYFYTGNTTQGEVILNEIIRGGQEMGGDGQLYNALAWMTYARRSLDVKLLQLGVQFAKEAVERSKKLSKELTARALDTQGCLLCVLSEYDQARASFLAAVEANKSSNLGEAITWIEFKRALKALNDTGTYQKFQDYF